jgi:uncharacterized protein (DUF736 family)
MEWTELHTMTEDNMSGQYDNNLRGVLFKNERKTAQNHPDYTGNCEIEGKEYWISAWIKQGRNSGKNFMSLAFRIAKNRSAACRLSMY